ncbi:MAG TPA: hypothetical protein ENH65_01245, partial [Candidatus Aminicenantes bacterium]|nr:hypothetical protein [Candidatus Aminicenantes bacterium]
MPIVPVDESVGKKQFQNVKGGGIGTRSVDPEIAAAPFNAAAKLGAAAAGLGEAIQNRQARHKKENEDNYVTESTNSYKETMLGLMSDEKAVSY